MLYLIGVAVALAAVVFGRASGFERERAFYPLVLTAIASYYILFGGITGDAGIVAMESAFALGFVALATWGFRRDLWVAAAGLAAHGVFDLVRGSVLVHAGVPPWWPTFCLAADVVLAAYLGWLLVRGRLASTPAPRVA